MLLESAATAAKRPAAKKAKPVAKPEPAPEETDAMKARRARQVRRRRPARVHSMRTPRAHAHRAHIVHTRHAGRRAPAYARMHAWRPARDLTRPCRSPRPLCSPAQLRLIRAVASMPRKAAAKLITSSKLAPASPARGARPPSPHLEWTQPALEWTQPHIRNLHSNPTRP